MPKEPGEPKINPEGESRKYTFEDSLRLHSGPEEIRDIMARLEKEINQLPNEKKEKLEQIEKEFEIRLKDIQEDLDVCRKVLTDKEPEVEK